MQAKSGYIDIGNAKLYYQVAGEGQPLVMIHAGIADSRMWDRAFAYFADRFQVVRYDQRGYGKSEPAPGEFSHLKDLTALLDRLGIHENISIMGCSMGGGLAMNYALANPSRMKALIMVDSGPTGLDLDVPELPIFAEVEKAYNAGDYDRVAELETQVWFDGMGRAAEQVDPAMRKLVLEMDRTALSHEIKGLGKRLPDTGKRAAERLGEIRVPVLVIVGEHDTPYILAAADYMVEKIPSARKVVIEDAAHLPNMDHPEEFNQVVMEFLKSLPT